MPSSRKRPLAEEDSTDEASDDGEPVASASTAVTPQPPLKRARTAPPTGERDRQDAATLQSLPPAKYKCEDCGLKLRYKRTLESHWNVCPSVKLDKECPTPTKQ